MRCTMRANSQGVMDRGFLSLISNKNQSMVSLKRVRYLLMASKKEPMWVQSLGSVCDFNNLSTISPQSIFLIGIYISLIFDQFQVLSSKMLIYGLKRSKFIDDSQLFTNRIEFVMMAAIISMKFNEDTAKDYMYQPKTGMNAGKKNVVPIETKIIVVKQTAIPNNKDSTDASSKSEAYKQLMSQSTTQVLRAPPQIPSDDEDSQEQKHEEQEQQSSIRKLYKQMKQEQQVQYEQPDFLYQSNRGEAFVQEPMKPNQVISKDQKHESGTLKSNSLLDLLYRQIPAKGMVECLVKLPSSFLSMEKCIQLYLFKQKKLLLQAKKSRLGLSSQYNVTTSMKDSIASFVSNQSRSEYKYLKKILHHKEQETSQKQEQTKATYNSSIIKLKQVKVQLSSLESQERSYIVFQPNMLGTKQERIKIIRPRTKVGKSIRFSDIKATYQNFQYDRIEIFESKMAEKNHKGELVLDFKTKNIMQSAKNVLIEDEYGRVCLAFYKRKENVYMLSVMSPFNIMEGFFIAVSNIDHLFF